MFEISGKIKIIDETQSFNSGFTKREFVITTGDSKYPQDIKFEIVKDKCTLLDNFSVGQDVHINFDIRGNEYNGRHYVNLNCWKIQSHNGQQTSSHSEANTNKTNVGNEEPSAADLRNNFDDSDEIPF